jgi:outer membrane murein-binding lipoprotein Lpp
MAADAELARRILRLLAEQPELREELGRALRLAELDRLTRAVADLAGAQGRTEERIATLTARVDALAEQMATLTARVDALAEQMAALTARVDALAEQMAALTARVDALAARMDALAAHMSTLAGYVDSLRGQMLELRYASKAPAYLGLIARRLHVLSHEELDDLLEEALAGGRLTEEEAEQVRLADLVARGRRREDASVVYLVVEVSWGVGVDDVRRAAERAELLSRAGVDTLAVVAGSWVGPDAAQVARGLGVWQVVDGHAVAPGSASRSAG